MNLIAKFDPWKGNLCTCPDKYSLSAYTGCNHGCLYCYASSYIKDFPRVREKKDFLKRLGKEIKKIPEGSIITMANSSDPYNHLEKSLTLTRRAIKIIKERKLSINITTKSPLILRDLDILKGYRKTMVSISLNTLDRDMARELEPGTSSPQDRLKTIKELSLHLPVAVRLDPLIYPLTTGALEETIAEIKTAGAIQVITSTYKIKPDNFKRMSVAFPEHSKLWYKLYVEQGERIGGYTYLPKLLRKNLIERVRKAVLEQDLKFSSCREGFSGLNTAVCDGSSIAPE